MSRKTDDMSDTESKIRRHGGAEQQSSDVVQLMRAPDALDYGKLLALSNQSRSVTEDLVTTQVRESAAALQGVAVTAPG